MYYFDSHRRIGQIIATAKNADESVHSISRLTTRQEYRTWIPRCMHSYRSHKRSPRRMVGTCTRDTTCRKGSFHVNVSSGRTRLAAWLSGTALVIAHWAIQTPCLSGTFWVFSSWAFFARSGSFHVYVFAGRTRVAARLSGTALVMAHWANRTPPSSRIWCVISSWATNARSWSYTSDVRQVLSSWAFRTYITIQVSAIPTFWGKKSDNNCFEYDLLKAVSMN